MPLKPYVPIQLPLKNLDWNRLVPSIGYAREMLAHYDEIIQPIPVQVLEIFKWEEAIATLRSQKINARIQEVLRFALDGTAEEKRAALLQKIVNAKEALDCAMKWSKKDPFHSFFLCHVHALLKKDAPNPKEIGRFRKRQNWIGAPGSPIHKNYFLPPKSERIPIYLKNLQKYARGKEEPLVQLAILFAQFLMIHPFMDGNGRVVRCCVPIFMHQKNLLSKPFLFLSAYFEKHRSQYLQTLFNISDKDDWEGWIFYFLKAVAERAKSMKQKAKHLYERYQETGESRLTF